MLERRRPPVLACCAPDAERNLTNLPAHRKATVTKNSVSATAGPRVLCARAALLLARWSLPPAQTRPPPSAEQRRRRTLLRLGDGGAELHGHEVGNVRREHVPHGVRHRHGERAAGHGHHAQQQRQRRVGLAHSREAEPDGLVQVHGERQALELALQLVRAVVICARMPGRAITLSSHYAACPRVLGGRSRSYAASPSGKREWQKRGGAIVSLRKSKFDSTMLVVIWKNKSKSTPP